jgi:hypothetical protein
MIKSNKDLIITRGVFDKKDSMWNLLTQLVIFKFDLQISVLNCSELSCRQKDKHGGWVFLYLHGRGRIQKKEISPKVEMYLKMLVYSRKNSIFF